MLTEEQLATVRPLWYVHAGRFDTEPAVYEVTHIADDGEVLAVKKLSPTGDGDSSDDIPFVYINRMSAYDNLVDALRVCLVSWDVQLALLRSRRVQIADWLAKARGPVCGECERAYSDGTGLYCAIDHVARKHESLCTHKPEFSKFGYRLAASPKTQKDEIKDPVDQEKGQADE